MWVGVGRFFRHQAAQQFVQATKGRDADKSCDRSRRRGLRRRTSSRRSRCGMGLRSIHLVHRVHHYPRPCHADGYHADASPSSPPRNPGDSLSDIRHRHSSSPPLAPARPLTDRTTPKDAFSQPTSATIAQAHRPPSISRTNGVPGPARQERDCWPCAPEHGGWPCAPKHCGWPFAPKCGSWPFAFAPECAAASSGPPCVCPQRGRHVILYHARSPNPTQRLRRA